MSTPINDGGPAFPEIRTQQENENRGTQFEVYSAGGMTLRDWLAGQALVGILACPTDFGERTTKKLRAEYAYQCADEMLAAREKGKTP